MTFTLIFKDISEERDIPKENYTINMNRCDDNARGGNGDALNGVGTRCNLH